MPCRSPTWYDCTAGSAWCCCCPLLLLRQRAAWLPSAASAAGCPLPSRTSCWVPSGLRSSAGQPARFAGGAASVAAWPPAAASAATAAPSAGQPAAAPARGDGSEGDAAASAVLLPAPLLPGLGAAVLLSGAATTTMPTVRLSCRLAAPAASASASTWLRRERGPAAASSAARLAPPLLPGLGRWRAELAGAAASVACDVASAVAAIVDKPEARAPTTTTSVDASPALPDGA